MGEPLSGAVRRLRAGEDVEEAARLLDEFFRPRLLRYFGACAFPRPDAEDLVQKTLIRVFQGVGRVRDEESFVAWVFTIARNVRRTAQSRQRREDRWLVADGERAESTPDPGTAADAGHPRSRRIDWLAEAIARLPPQQRQCLVLRVRDELSYAEIAETLRLSPHTVRNHLSQARKSVRERLDASVGGMEEEGAVVR